MAKIDMPNGDDANISGDDVLVVRELAAVERKWGDVETSSRSIIFTKSGAIYPILEVPQILEKLDGVKFAELTAPNEMPLQVNVEAVTDRDDASRALDDPRTRSVLRFGAGRKAATVRVRETKEQLEEIWNALGLPLDPLA
ncbi:hypothetical protein [Rhizobium leguminosarum]|uniref:hypothetical protein n=1 Tax=Rhizobium leguminosarum TaxID=384 RepID=UPI001441E8B6|nr:hypothetical protein [Rhizobium leguminosarum]MBY5864310.1 hypothetical protein [Rhizobium leguminosarum]NKM03326.1 hypothetical protein [Rhizobium leguminosarum bv. viciae]